MSEKTESTVELTVQVDDVPVYIIVQSADGEFETSLKALFLAGQPETLKDLIEQAFEQIEEDENA